MLKVLQYSIYILAFRYSLPQIKTYTLRIYYIGKRTRQLEHDYPTNF